MLISAIHAPMDVTSPHGLKPVQMENLGPMVVLVGRNGAGKSRLLSFIHMLVAHHLPPDARSRITANREANALALTKNPDASDSDRQKWQREVADAELALRMHTLLRVIEPGGSVVYFVPKSLDVVDCNILNKRDQLAAIDNLLSPGVDHLAKGVLSYIQVTQNRWVASTTHPLKFEEKEKERVVEAYVRLQKLIKDLIGVELDRTIEDDATLFGFPLGQAKLSDGQKILLQLCVAIHAQGASIDKLILFLDEPENHLHPGALLEVLEAIKDKVTRGQIFVATHSLSLMAAVDPQSLWYVDANEARSAGRIPEIVLQGLVGSDEEVARFEDFLSLPGRYAMQRYAAECLLPPATLGLRARDRQIVQIADLLHAKRGERQLRILDYGAGKGRLLAGLMAEYSGNAARTAEWLDYAAFDSSDHDAEACKAQVAQVYGASERRYFNDKKELIERIGRGSVDAVILCNVLHEIDPRNWLELFSRDSIIVNLLRDDGHLLIVEDHWVPTGEKAYENGFLVLDSEELRVLFAIEDSDLGFVPSADEVGRLKTHSVPKAALSRVTAEGRRKAIETLVRHAAREVQRLRRERPSYRNGQLHGFWVHQFTNANLVLSDLQGGEGNRS